jgi:hypothetical protein
MFLVALSAGLGGGAYLFKDQLFGAQGLFPESSTPDVAIVTPVEPVAIATTDEEVTISNGDGDGSEVPEVVEATEDSPSPPQVQVAGMVTFVSAVEPLRKMKVRCGSESQQGETFVAVSVDVASGGCSVSIWPVSGSRQSARVEAPSEGVYRCFEGGEGTCER